MTDVVERVSPAEASSVLERAVALQSVVRSYQEQIEHERRIPPALVEQLKAAGLYRLVVPRELGGLQVDLLTFLRVVELIAQADGSAGWNLANNSVGQLIALSLSDDGTREIFAHGPDTIVAGTAVPGGGTAVRSDGGYIVSGRWRFGSGCNESRWMMANFDLDGRLLRAFFPRGDVEVIDTWDMTGMLGTGSHDWAVKEQFVPDRRTVEVPGRLLINQWSRWSGTFYQLPIHALIGPHHSAIATGIARDALDMFADLAGAKVPRGRTGLLREQVQVQDTMARAEALLGAGQTFRSGVLRDAWDVVEDGRQPSQEQCARCRLGATYSVDAARQAMDLVYRAGGTTSSQRTHPLARCWRDLQVVAQAASTAPEWYALTGRVFLGLDPGNRLA